jgi:hypothetical protein
MNYYALIESEYEGKVALARYYYDECCGGKLRHSIDIIITMLPIEIGAPNIPHLLYPTIFKQEESIDDQIILLPSRSISAENMLKKQQSIADKLKASDEINHHDSSTNNGMLPIIEDEPSSKRSHENKEEVLSPKTKFMKHKEKYTDYIIKLLGCTFAKNTIDSSASQSVNNTSIEKVKKTKTNISPFKTPCRHKGYEEIESVVSSNESLKMLKRGIVSHELNQYLNANCIHSEKRIKRQNNLMNAQTLLPPIHVKSNTVISLVKSINNIIQKSCTNFQKDAQKKEDTREIYENVGFNFKKIKIPPKYNK